jgi:dimethylglycine dehydrogenase
VVGVTTSGAYGHAVEKSLAFAYVPPTLIEDGTALEVMVFTEMRKARIIPESIWDPMNERLKA